MRARRTHTAHKIRPDTCLRKIALLLTFNARVSSAVHVASMSHILSYANCARTSCHTKCVSRARRERLAFARCPPPPRPPLAYGGPHESPQVIIRRNRRLRPQRTHRADVIARDPFRKFASRVVASPLRARAQGVSHAAPPESNARQRHAPAHRGGAWTGSASSAGPPRPPEGERSTCVNNRMNNVTTRRKRVRPQLTGRRSRMRQQASQMTRDACTPCRMSPAPRGEPINKRVARTQLQRGTTRGAPSPGSMSVRAPRRRTSSPTPRATSARRHRPNPAYKAAICAPTRLDPPSRRLT